MTLSKQEFVAVDVPADNDSVVQALHLRRALFVVVDAGLVEPEVLTLRPRNLMEQAPVENQTSLLSPDTKAAVERKQHDKSLRSYITASRNIVVTGLSGITYSVT